ncbi:MAG: hypothetical protein ACM3IG_06150, partial [Myxococcales bacterium]
MKRIIVLLAAAASLSACSTLGGEGFGYSDYSLVRVHDVSVGDGSLIVAAPRPWNRRRPELFEDVRAVEDWTL